MIRRKFPDEPVLPEPLPDDTRIMTRKGYVCRVRRRGRVKIYKDPEVVDVKRGKNKGGETLEVYEDGEWQYYLVHDQVIAGTRYEMTGSQLFTHSQLVADGVVMLREFEGTSTQGAQEGETSCQTENQRQPEGKASSCSGSSQTSRGSSGTSSLASLVRGAAQARRSCRSLCRRS